MSWKRSLSAVVIASAAFVVQGDRPVAACGDYGGPPPAAVALATSNDLAGAAAAADELRAMGPAGLRFLMSRHADAIAAHAADPTTPQPGWDAIAAAIDRVAGQKDAGASGLYWYTDLEQAKAAAASQKKPILSLRLLGTLDTELSCANSRFFRTALYANKDLSAYLRKSFVLHWKSVRPVPKVTIDFGDGRVVERTITGNSIHYVLDADGGVIDGIPGLYGPAAFRQRLTAAATIAGALRGVPDRIARHQSLAGWHRQAGATALSAWAADLQAVGVEVPITLVQLTTTTGAVPPAAVGSSGTLTLSVVQPGTVVTGTGQPPTAAAAGRMAIGKGVVEMPLVRALTSSPSPAALAASTTDDVWQRIAARHGDDARLDAGSRAVVAAKNPDAVRAGRLSGAKWVQEDPVVRLVRGFERSMAVDTVRNEYLLHATIHQWLGDPAAQPVTVDALNERVYAELFLTPSSDPWLGLVPADAYSAIENGGVRK